MKYIAFTTKGLENIVQKELVNYNCSIIEQSIKTIVFESNTDIGQLVKLKTIDDLCIYIDEIKDLLKNENAVSIITSRLINTDFSQIIITLNSFREIKPNNFSITASVFGTKYNTSILAEKLSKALINRRKWEYTPKSHENFDIRVSVTKNHAIIGVRVTEKSLHHRDYKQYLKKGSLRPTIAAAMVFETNNNKNGLKIVDNFCGSGTILCEALLAGNKVYGGDIDKESVEFTKKNLMNIKKGDYEIKVQDAIKTSWTNDFFDCAISNLPWDKQIQVDKLTTLYSKTIVEYKRILKPNAAICLLGIKPDFIVSQIKKVFNYKNIQVFKLGYLGQKPYVVIGRVEQYLQIN